MKPTADIAAAALAAQLEASSLTSEVDEYGELQAEARMFAEKEKRLKALRAKFQERAASDGVKPDSSTTYKGNRFSVIVGPAKKERQVTNRSKLKRLLIRLKVFEKLWKVDLGEIDKYTTEEERAAFISEGLTGSRKVEAVVNSQSK